MINKNDPEREAAKQAQLLRAAQESIGTPAHAEALEFIAQMAMLRYRSFVRAGFTEAQAIELTKARV